MNVDFYRTRLRYVKRGFLLLFIVGTTSAVAQRAPEKDVDLDKIPPRIIRACCAFGYDLKLWGVPFVSIDQVISVNDLAEHRYMGDKNEGIGTVYTKKGGFIDIGHLRDQIDWTRYLYTFIASSRGKGKVVLPMRKEAGRKTLYLNIPETFDKSECILLAGKITYDFALWHEISTWYGASTVPFVKERFSSFSVEDVYSNLLGIHVGMKALHSKLPFDKAATNIIVSTLDSLGVVKTSAETYDAYNAVFDKWYTNKKRIPRTNVTLMRDPDVLRSTRPWLVADATKEAVDPIVLAVPLSTTKGGPLTDFYQFTIDLDRKFPLEKLFPDSQNRIIDQGDFGVLLTDIAEDFRIMGQLNPVDRPSTSRE